MDEGQTDRPRPAKEKYAFARAKRDHAERGADPNEIWEARRDLVVAEDDVIIADLLARVAALEEGMQVLLAAHARDPEGPMSLDSESNA